MLEEFESYFGNVDVKELVAFLKEAKEESQQLKAQTGKGDQEADEVVQFMTVLLENIEDEIQGLTSLKTLDLKKKVRLYSMIHLFHDICGTMDDEFDDEEFDDEDDEDEEEENDQK